MRGKSSNRRIVEWSNWRKVRGVAYLAMVLVCGCEPAADVVIGNGTGEARSLAEAVGRVRELRARGEVKNRVAVIAVRAGRHRLEQPVVLTPEDSHLRIVGSGAERCVFDGGLELPPFKVGRDGVWETDVPRGTDFDQVWVDGRRATMARSPNRFYYYMKDMCNDSPDTAFLAEPADIAPLAKLSRQELDRVAVSYWQSWDMGYLRVKSANVVTGRLDFKTAAVRQFFYWHKTRPRYVIANFRAALDAPGEWFHDVTAGKLLYIPRNGESPATARAVVPVAKGLVTFDGNRAKGRVIRDVTFERVGFEHTALPIGNGIGNFQAAMNVKDAAIAGKGVDSLRIVSCRVAHAGGHGMMLWNGSRNVTVERSLFEDLGAGAIGFSGGNSPKAESEINEFLTVRNSILRHGGRMVQGAIGVWIGHARDCLVEHNDIYDFYYTGVSCGWTWGYAETICRRNRIAFNRVHHIGQGVLSDMGAVYTLGDNGRSEVCNNWVSDVDGYKDNGSPTFGLYTDEGSRGFLFASNLVENCRYCALHQHYGRDNCFVNNICVGFGNCAVLRSRPESHTTMAMTNNVFWWRSPTTDVYTGWGSFEMMAKDLPTDGNIYWCDGGQVAKTAFKGKDFAAWQAAGNDRNGAIADPLFVDAAHGDWRLRPDSPALKAGFVPFDWKQCGVLKSDAAWAAKAAERTWDEFAELPRAPKFTMRRYEFDALNYLKNKDNWRKQPLSVYHTGRANGAFTVAPDGEGLRLTDSKEEKHAFAPHFKFWPPMADADLRMTFVFRPVSGDGMEFEVRDWEDERGTLKSAFQCCYIRGKVIVNGKSILAVPLGMWATVEIRLNVTAGAKNRLEVSVTRADGESGSAKFEHLANDGFKKPNWYGFVTYGDGTAIWDLKKLTIEAL